MNDNLPPLPKPEALQRKQLNHGGYEMRPVFTADQMREYGQLCRQQALEEAAELCDNIPTLYGFHSCFIASKKIKELK